MGGEPVLDVADAKNRVDGDKDLYFDLIEAFFSEYDGHVAAIQSGLATGDSHKVERAAHTVKGALANLSGKRAQALAFSIERAGKSGNLAGVAETFAQLQLAVDEFKSEAERVKRSDAWERA